MKTTIPEIAWQAITADFHDCKSRVHTLSVPVRATHAVRIAGLIKDHYEFTLSFEQIRTVVHAIDTRAARPDLRNNQ